jgi:hypothetical protein
MIGLRSGIQHLKEISTNDAVDGSHSPESRWAQMVVSQI